MIQCEDSPAILEWLNINHFSVQDPYSFHMPLVFVFTGLLSLRAKRRREILQIH